MLRYILGVGHTPGGLDLKEALNELRGACTARLSAAQPKVPDVQFWMIKLLGIMTLSVFPLMHIGDSADTVLSELEAFLYASLVAVVTLFISVLEDLSDTGSGLYSVAPVRNTLQAALLAKVDALLRRVAVRDAARAG